MREHNEEQSGHVPERSRPDGAQRTTQVTPPPGPASLLALQRLAGNRAVGSLIGAPVTIQRQGPSHAPSSDSAAGTGPHIVIEAFIDVPEAGTESSGQAATVQQQSGGSSTGGSTGQGGGGGTGGHAESGGPRLVLECVSIFGYPRFEAECALSLEWRLPLNERFSGIFSLGAVGGVGNFLRRGGPLSYSFGGGEAAAGLVYRVSKDIELALRAFAGLQYEREDTGVTSLSGPIGGELQLIFPLSESIDITFVGEANAILPWYNFPGAARRDDPEADPAGALQSGVGWNVGGGIMLGGELDLSRLLGLQRAIGNSGVTDLIEEERSPVHEVINSGRGAPLDPDTRADMEARFGQDFGDVRVHTDVAAHESARSVNAHAYTVGPNIVFQRNRYDPSSSEGQHMLAHELTHVVQQRSGPVDGAEVAGGVRVSDPSDRFEREAAAHADRVMSAPAPSLPPSDGAVAQRWDEQTVPAQREEGEQELDAPR